MRLQAMSFLLACFLIAGCATAEFRAAAQECSPEAFSQYPVNNVTSFVTLQRAIQVPSGQTHCTTMYFGQTAQTNCQQVMRTELIPYQQAVVTDTNASPRDRTIKACAANLCMQRYGNSECKK